MGQLCCTPRPSKLQKRSSLPLRVRKTLSKSAGTLIFDRISNNPEGGSLGPKGLACAGNIARIELDPSDADEQLALFDRSEFVVESEGVQGRARVLISGDAEAKGSGKSCAQGTL